jgi:hypothetical protein
MCEAEARCCAYSETSLYASRIDKYSSLPVPPALITSFTRRHTKPLCKGSSSFFERMSEVARTGEGLVFLGNQDLAPYPTRVAGGREKATEEVREMRNAKRRA